MSSNNCDKTLNCLIKNKIKLICIDFDNTLLSIHTYGKWDDTALNLAKHVRPEFKLFISKCLQQNIYIGIVTFSSQTELVIDVLKHVFKEDSKKIFVKTTNMSYKSKTKFCDKLLIENNIKMERKIPMMLSIMFDIYTDSNIIVPIKSVLLIDDDWANISSAKNNGFHSYHYKNSSDISMYNQLQSLEGFNKSTSYTFIIGAKCKLFIIVLIILYAFWNDITKKQYGTRLSTIQI